MLGIGIHKDKAYFKEILGLERRGILQEYVDLEYKSERPDSEIFFNQDKRLYGKGIVKVRVYYQ